MFGGIEKRKHPRFAVKLPVEFRLLGGSVVTSRIGLVKAVTRDISEGGLFIELNDTFISDNRSLAVDNFLLFRSTLDIQLKLPNRPQPVRALGKVVWIEEKVPGKEFKHGVAVSFNEISPENVAVIRQYVAEHLHNTNKTT